MRLQEKLRASVSELALKYYWNQKKKEIAMSRAIRVPRPRQCDHQNVSGFREIEEYGYIRRMNRRDVFLSQSRFARPGWFGYFDGDGDLIFWTEECNDTPWLVHGKLVIFQSTLH